MSINLNGIFTAVPTPFDERGDLATDKLASNLEHWNQTDLAGYLILGSTGEFPHLSHDEKLAVIETARDAVPHDKLLLVGTSELSTRATLELTREAADRGADAAVVVTPFYDQRLLDEEHLVAHYRRIADHSPIPVLVYLIPQFSGVYLRPETVAELAEHPNIVGLKDSSGDMAQLKDLFRDVKAEEFSILVGAPTILKEAMANGATGGVLAVAGIAPRACTALERECRFGGTGRTDELQERLSKFSRKTTVNGVGHLKAALDLTGLYGYLPRSPLPAASEQDRQDIAAAIEESGFFDRTVDGETWIEVDDIGGYSYAD